MRAQKFDGISDMSEPGTSPVQFGWLGGHKGYGLPSRKIGASGVMEAANIRVAKTARMVLFMLNPPVPKHRSIIS